MHGFLVGHATHPDWRGALALASAQVQARRAAHEASAAGPLTLGLVYFTDHYAAHAQALYDHLHAQWPGVSWVGSVGVGVAASGVEYFDEPALVLMLAALPNGRFEVFSGARKLQSIEPFSALVHADPATPDLAELIGEMSDRTSSGYLFGGLAASRGVTTHIADGVWQGGLSGVAFTRDVALVSRVTQGCQPLGPTRTITACERHVVTQLDGLPALPLLLADLGLPDLEDPRQAVTRLRATLVGLTDAHDSALARGGQFGADTRVRHLVGLDRAQQAVAVADLLEPGMKLSFCQRDVSAARRDLVRICSEIRDEVESQAEALAPGAPASSDAPGAPPTTDSGSAILGAVYISCSGRGGPHFGGPSAELKIVQHALGDVPLVGFFANGEIARHHLYGYTGVLTVFTGNGR
jgi:small ligand-binding sensory domain FIST